MKKKLILLLLPFLFVSTIFARTYRVLYLGNSLTYVNNVPDLVAQIALSHGDTIIWDSNTPGGHTLLQHSTNPVSLTKINDRKWDFVIIQAQSQETAFPDGQLDTDIYPPAKFLTDSIHRNNACTRVLFYMPAGWKYGDNMNCPGFPDICTYDGQFARIRQTHLNIADSMDAGIIPSGISYRRSRAMDSTIDLWYTDNVHPSIFGSYLTALNMYAAITKQSTLGTSYAPSGVGSTAASYLQGIADTVVLDSLDTWKLNGVFVNDSVGFHVIWNEIGYRNTYGFTLKNDRVNSDSLYYIIHIRFRAYAVGDSDYNLDTLLGLSTYSDSIIFMFNDTIHFCHDEVYTVSQIHISPCSIDTISLESNIICEGINDLQSASPFNIYPNPATNEFMIEQMYDFNKKYGIEIRNMNGELMLRSNLDNNGKKLIDIKSLPCGVYLLRLYNEKESYTKKLLINQK